MPKAIVWNIRGSNKAVSKAYLSLLVQRHKPDILVILEHKAKAGKLPKLAKSLRFNGFLECPEENRYIWILWHPKVVKLANFVVHEQCINCSVSVCASSESFVASFIYGWWNKHARRRLWEFLLSSDPGPSIPWILAGDFNVVAAREEKTGGNQASNDGGIREFNEFMLVAGVFDPGFQGTPHTWTNNQQGSSRVWIRLDRVLLNGACLASFPGFRVIHLDRGTSDHTPILLQSETLTKPRRSFTYLRMWSSHSSFWDSVLEAWGEVSCRNPITNFVIKLRRTGKKLSHWNHNQFGNVDRSIRQAEERISVLEASLAQGWSESAAAELTASKTIMLQALRCKQQLLEDQARSAWLAQGDENTSYFQAAIRERAFYAKPKLTKQNGSAFFLI